MDYERVQAPTYHFTCICIAVPRTFIFLQEAPFRGVGDLLAVLSMTVMITKMGEGATSGTVIIRRNLPGFRAFKLQGLTVYDLLPGTKTANFSQWVEEPFDEMDSTLAVQQYIQQTIRRLQLRKALLPTLSHISKIQEPSRCGRDPDSS